MYCAAIDQGTTRQDTIPRFCSLLLYSSRFIVFDKNGSIISVSQKEHEQIMPHPGWVEHDPMTILKNVEVEHFDQDRLQFCVSDCLKQGNLALSDLAAIGITNQRETLVIWDKFTGLPVYNAIVWMDCRGDEVIHNFTNAHDKEWYRQKTGLPLSSYFTGPKLNWALTHVPEVKKGFEEHRILVGTIDCWLIWNLTGGIHVLQHALS